MLPELKLWSRGVLVNTHLTHVMCFSDLKNLRWFVLMESLQFLELMWNVRTSPGVLALHRLASHITTAKQSLKGPPVHFSPDSLQAGGTSSRLGRGEDLSPGRSVARAWGGNEWPQFLPGNWPEWMDDTVMALRVFNIVYPETVAVPFIPSFLQKVVICTCPLLGTLLGPGDPQWAVW